MWRDERMSGESGAMFRSSEAARLEGVARGGAFRSGSLARHLMALAVLIMLPAILLSAWAGVRYAAIDHKARRGEVLSEARALAASVDREFENYDVILESLARAGPLQHGDFSAFRQDAAPLVASVRGATLEILRPDGGPLGPSEGPMAADAVPSSYQPGASSVTDVDKTADGTPIVAVVLPMLSGGQTAFVVRLVIPARRLVEIIRAQNYREGWFASILDRNGIVVARLREGVAQSGIRSTGDVASAAATAPEGVLGSIPTIEGDQVLSAYHRLPFGWIVGVAANPRVLDAPLARTLWTIGVLGAAALLLGFVLAALVGRKLTRGASALLRSAQNLGGQAPVAFAQTGISEFDSASAAFVEASAKLRQRDAQRLAVENDLRASEERFRLAADAVAGIIYDWDVATTRSNRSRGLLTVLGFDPEEIESDGAWWDSRVHPNDAEGVRRSADQAVAEGRPRWEHEYRVRHRDGHWVQVLDRAVILYNSDGTPQRWVGCSIDVSEQHRIEDALRASEERFRLIADSLPQLVWTAGPDGRVDYTNANRARYGTMGMRRTDWDGVIHPDDRRGTIAAWLKSKDSGEPYEMEHRLMIAGRGFVWHLTRAVASRDSSGEIVKWYGTTIDVQDHKLREESIRELMMEVNHRSKNLLAVTQAIARQTVSSAKTVAEFEKKFSARLLGLAASQDLLTQEQWRGVSLGALLRSQAGHYAAGGAPNLHSEGPTVLLSAASAQAVGMAFHELATNAAKYGAFSVKEGSVSARWSIEYGEPEPVLEFIWTEHGGPAVAPHPARGFGAAIVEDLVARQVRGEAKLTFSEDGLQWRLRAPLKMLAAA